MSTIVVIIKSFPDRDEYSASRNRLGVTSGDCTWVAYSSEEKFRSVHPEAPRGWGEDGKIYWEEKYEKDENEVH